MSSSIEERLSREVLRKLRLAIEAEHKEDREIVCSEVFSDVTGELDALAKEKLGVASDKRFYEILAPYFNKKWDNADALLYICRQLWGLSYIAPVYTLLLHQWLLLNKDAGGQAERQKHVSVCIQGARQLFWADVHSAAQNFKPLFDFLATEVVHAPDEERVRMLPHTTWAGLQSVVACFLPLYLPPQGLRAAIEQFPGPRPKGSQAQQRPADGGDSMDLVVGEIVETVRNMRNEASLLRYLRALKALQGAFLLPRTRRITRIRLQAELYSLTTRGGPRYAPRSVNQAAFEVLDALFPLGQRSRRLVSLTFRLALHPGEWPRSLLLTLQSLLYAVVCPGVATWRALSRLPAWLRWSRGGSRARQKQQ